MSGRSASGVLPNVACAMVVFAVCQQARKKSSHRRRSGLLKNVSVRTRQPSGW